MSVKSLWSDKIRKSFAAKKLEKKGKRSFEASELPPELHGKEDSSARISSSTPHFSSPVSDIFDSQNFSFQEIVPLNAGNVLVSEDNEPASKWLELIDLALNSTNKAFRRNQTMRLKACNCPSEVKKKSYGPTCFSCRFSYDFDFEDEESEKGEDEKNGFDDDEGGIVEMGSSDRGGYSYIVSKQMVGIFITIWAKKELVRHMSHFQICSVGRGIMGRLGNKGCISVSMCLHQTSFCFICCHLASGEKEGDELRRNSDVIKISKNTYFRRICDNHHRINPKKIVDHDRVIWLGDLNYRISLSYSETKRHLEENNWDALLEKDQLRVERESGRVFKGWKEGKIYFPPTYKYSNNSDSYSGDNATSKSKRRTPAWCDRILWHGNGIVQLFYIRGESRLSDHRPVFAGFSVDVEVLDDRFRKEISASNMKVGVEELLPS
ncbi:type I inositol polyphosphate 5-phosphatase 10-like isoform X2 [Phalaenopsis equestris]|uniref:type I inositol polyphosphate 5-phosphatase 10-like isoform X2 n=1 Tax=Phalaenopsis equestris TaxID=78828 RepID=UPI0009E3B151|nr:type I inositol polyphosphate 5-phosphatase 10-like isoform X2 [Phalaenopsis equestris]